MGFFQTSGILNRRGFFGGGIAFKPSDIAGLQLWLDATTGLFDATTGGNAVTTDGSAVARWEDQSGNGLHFIQATLNNRPLLKTSVQNSKNVVRFDGTNDVMSRDTGTFLSDKSGCTVFMVRKFISDPTTTRGLFRYRGNFSETAANMLFVEAGRTASKPAVAGRRLTSDSFVSVSSVTSVSTSAFELHCGIFDYQNTDLILYINKTNAAQNLSFQTSGNIGTPTSISLNLGAEQTTTNFSNADIAEVVIYDSALSESNRQSVENYLYEKWGIA